MKAFAPFFLCVLTAASLRAAPVQEISTLTGKTYRQCEIVKVHPDGVSFTHANGAAKVLFTDLSAEWRTRLGYDPVKAKAYQREQEERRQQQAEVRRKHEQERGEALLLAQQIELARLRGIEVQARAAQEAAAKASPLEDPVVPVVSQLGAVHDSRDFRGAGYRDRFYNVGYYPAYSGYGYPGYGYGYSYPLCGPYYHGGHSHLHLGGSLRGRIGGVTFSVGH